MTEQLILSVAGKLASQVSLKLKESASKDTFFLVTFYKADQ